MFIHPILDLLLFLLKILVGPFVAAYLGYLAGHRAGVKTMRAQVLAEIETQFPSCGEGPKQGPETPK